MRERADVRWTEIRPTDGRCVHAVFRVPGAIRGPCTLLPLHIQLSFVTCIIYHWNMEREISGRIVQ